MAEYIDRQAALEILTQYDRAHIKQKGKPILGIASMVVDIEDIPAADVRPVVTCGECKHWFENGTDYCSCDRDALLRERDFFCAAGEKKEET